MVKQRNLYLKLMLLFHSSNVISVDVPWPDGKYGLPMPKEGCPHTAGVTWESGWILQDMVKESGYAHSQPFHLESDLRDDIKRYFCMKTQTKSTSPILWPPGKYCIYRKGRQCPVQMTTGYYYWDDEGSILNQNSEDGAFPDGEYSTNTKIFFCCRTDGDKSIPISLPTSKPFFLLAQGSARCQQVKWALATAEWLTYDTAGKGKRGAVYPYNGWLEKHPTIYYCYYQNCNYTRSGERGIVTSPNFPNPVPRGQFCSWRITVDPGYLVNLKFGIFSLAGNDTDTVEVFDGDNDTAPTIGVFTGNSAPPPLGVNSSSNTLFIILRSASDHETSMKNGNFRASFSKRETPAAQTTTTAPTTLQITTNNTFTERTAEPTNSPTQSSDNPEHVTTETTEPLRTEHVTGNSSTQGGARTLTGGGVGTVVAAVVVPLVIILGAGVVFFLYRKRKKEKPSGKEVSTVMYNSTAQDSATAAQNPIYDAEVLKNVDQCVVDQAYCSGNEGDYTYVESNVVQKVLPSLPKPLCDERESDNPLYDTAETDHKDKKLIERCEIPCQASLLSGDNNDGYLQPVEHSPKDQKSENPLYDTLEPSCQANPIYQCTN